ncbi:rhodanese-like domain-containing protein [Agromyces humi]|uniref:rhodanese-like domain-containing protein n=1 Tax=Agromyces humi TaxID=1766800 RepID=UPI0013587FF7|nr:rhodanese-like domain-containing protein [Agromyces humi]
MGNAVGAARGVVRVGAPSGFPRPEEVEAPELVGAPAELDVRARELDPAASVVVYCHLGVRSEVAARSLARAGFARVRNLAGGIDAWSRTVDPSVVRY